MNAPSPVVPIDSALVARPECGLAPLVVDLDGTLTQSDTLLESLVLFLKKNPLRVLQLPGWLLKGRAAFKAKVMESIDFPAHLLPYRQPLLDYLHDEKAKGRRLILATAAHRRIAEPVAAHLRVFDQVIATEDVNLKGRNKLQAILAQVGERFAYVGDCAADLEIWKRSESALIVGSPFRCGVIRRTVPIEREFPDPPFSALTWLRAIRVHQWTKNLLLFVPLLTSFAFLEVKQIITALLAFITFCLAGSATYLVNDLWDLENDRAHHRKRHRPLASGEIGIPAAIWAALLLLGAAFTVAQSVSMQFMAALLTYLVITSAYSWTLKKVMLIDVLVLASLYTLRILAGSIAIGVTTSSWLLVFSIFMFFSLALVKRCSELVALAQNAGTTTSGRNYKVSDLAVLWPMGVGAGLCSVIVFTLFIDQVKIGDRYESPQLMWLAVIVLTYWISRLWIKTARGEMHDDPIVFAMKDFGSRFTIAAIVVITLSAYFFQIELPTHS